MFYSDSTLTHFWGPRLNSDSTQHVFFPSRLNSDSTQHLFFPSRLNYDSTHLNQIRVRFDSRLMSRAQPWSTVTIFKGLRKFVFSHFWRRKKTHWNWPWPERSLLDQKRYKWVPLTFYHGEEHARFFTALAQLHRDDFGNIGKMFHSDWL